MTQLDDLAKRTGSAIIVVHHDSKGSAGIDWSQKAAGTYAMSAATEAQVHISRFGELEGNAPERLLRVRGRHLEGAEIFGVKHLTTNTSSAEVPPSYTPWDCNFKRLSAPRLSPQRIVFQATGLSRSGAHRHLDRLCRAGALNKRG